MSEIIDRLWKSEIQCIVHHNNQQYYLLLHRNSYLYHSIPLIFNFFKIPPTKLNQVSMYIFNKSVLIDWMLITDVVYELHNNTNDVLELELVLGINQSLLSFQHQLNSLSIATVFQSQWINKIKESCYIFNGSSKLIMSLSLQNSEKFWNSVIAYNGPDFENITRKIYISDIKCKNLPIKLWKLENNLIIEQFISLLTTFPNSNISEITLSMLLQQLKIDNTLISIHGIQPPLDVPILKLFKLLKCFDLFLHIVIKQKNF